MRFHRQSSSLRLACPILQAPIGSTASTDLAAAVSNAGGMGSLALTWTETQAAVKLVTELRSLTSKPFFVNFVLSFEPTALRACLEAGAPVVTFSWGLPGHLVNVVHSYGAQVGVQVGTVKGAQRALDQGCDFLICQGIEAGGHVQSSTTLRELLPRVLAEANDIPVVATGGLVDGEDIGEMLDLGAHGVMLGTRFVASVESLAHPLYKEALLQAESHDTVLTGCFDGGWPSAVHRVLRNGTFSEWEAAGCPPNGARPGEGEIIAKAGSRTIKRYDDTPPTVGIEGDAMACCLYAGAGVGKISDVRPAGDLVNALWRDAKSRATSANSALQRTR